MLELDPTAPPTPPRRSRWRWWLSLRGLMLLVLLVGAGLAAWVRLESARRAAVAAISAAGGTITWRDSVPTHTGTWLWLYRRTGLDFCREVDVVQLGRGGAGGGAGGAAALPPRPPVGPEVWEAIGRLGPVEYLVVIAEPVTPAHLLALGSARVAELQLIDMDSVDEATLAAIARRPGLLRLNIMPTRATLSPAAIRLLADADGLETLHLHAFDRSARLDLTPLRRLPHLRSLRIALSPLDPAALDELGTWPDLTALELTRTPVTDVQLHRIARTLPNLKSLALDGSQVTDAGVAALAGLTRLETVWLMTDSTRPGALTDASLRTLGQLPALTALNVTGGQFTDAGLDALAGRKLQVVRLGSVAASPAALTRFVAGRSWRLLGLRGPAVTDATLPLILPHLSPRTALDFEYAPLTDASAPALAALPAPLLDLTGTALTDAGLATLATATSARQVIAWGTHVTPAGAAAFRRARPRTILFMNAPGTED